MELFNKLERICKTKQFVDLKTMCSMHIGGIGELVCYPNSTRKLKKVLKLLDSYNVPFFLLGNGTNVVFEDGGYSAVLICLKELRGFKIRKNTITAHSGMNLFALNNICKMEGLGGLEWSYGIPGTVGGAVCMNAGAYGSEARRCVRSRKKWKSS